MLPAIAPVNTDRNATQMTMSQKVIFSTVNDSTTQKWNSCASLSLTFIRSPPCVCVLIVRLWVGRMKRRRARLAQGEREV